VLGDVGRGFYVPEDVAVFMRDRAMPAATILTPNHFELDFLAGVPSSNLAEVRKALGALHARGPRVILVTSAEFGDTPPDHLDLIASEGGALWRLRTPRAPIKVNGAGDVIAALFMNAWLETGNAATALARAASAVYALVAATASSGVKELALVAAQEEFANPSTVFAPEPL
jgi:pyridoxine kinase